MGKPFHFLAFLAMTGAAAGAPAQQPPTPAAVRPWQVDWGDYYCSIIRQPEPGRPYAAAILTTPGDDSSQLILLSQEAAAPPRGINRIVLQPGDRTFEVTSSPERRSGHEATAISGLDYGFRDALAAASELQLRHGEEIRARISLPDARAAVAAHRRCTAEISHEWGLDEAALAALSRRPVTTNHNGFRPEDYPAGALRTATQGRVIVRVAVSTDGRATDCATVATSGNAAIDATTCRVILARARFTPALDATGRPAAVRMVSTVTWRMQD